MNIALIGAGYWGKNLVRVFYELGVLRIICDLNETSLKERQKEHPNLKITTDISKILNDKNIDAAVIATPAITHYSLGKKVLESGKDIFIEKPLALKVEEGEKLVRLAKEKKRILMVGHLLLYHPAIIALKKSIQDGELGEVYYIYSNRLNFGKLRKEENVLWSFAPHDISVVTDILGMPKNISVFAHAYLQKDISDIVVSNFEFKGGKAAHIFVSWLNPFKEQKLTVIGSKAMAVFDDRVKDKLVVYHHKVEWSENKNPEAVKAEGQIIKISNNEPLTEEAKHFIECVEKRQNPITDGERALKVLNILNYCQKSIEKGGEAVVIKKY